ncbi:MAG: PD-(D/E)XK nuclease family protein [Xanthomonadales bacterium]|nr:PD-(D/E)XK nuclease family protein [Xanthomonadales bacterium]
MTQILGNSQAKIERLECLLAAMSGLPRRHGETTIFNIGGRGYYENATSDVLAFFLDPSREHGFNTTVLASLLSAAGIADAHFEPTQRPQREYPTSGGNRIDILVESKDHVLVIENKIRHTANNPFADYEKTAREAFPDKKALFVLLTYRDERVIERDAYGREVDERERKWKVARYKDLVKDLRERMGHIVMDRPYTKWTLLLREFVLTLEEEMADEKLEQALVDFGTKNAAALFEASDLLDKFITQVGERALSVVARKCSVADKDCAIKWHTWENGKAIRLLVPGRWRGGTNITLLVLSSGGFRCQIYVYGFSTSEHERVKGLIKVGNMTTWIAGGSICCSADLTSQLPDMAQAEALIEVCAERLNLLYPLPPDDATRLADA